MDVFFNILTLVSCNRFLRPEGAAFQHTWIIRPFFCCFLYIHISYIHNNSKPFLKSVFVHTWVVVFFFFLWEEGGATNLYLDFCFVGT